MVIASLWHTFCYFINCINFQASESWVCYLLQDICKALKFHHQPLHPIINPLHAIFTNTSKVFPSLICRETWSLWLCGNDTKLNYISERKHHYSEMSYNDLMITIKFALETVGCWQKALVGWDFVIELGSGWWVTGSGSTELWIRQRWHRPM